MSPNARRQTRLLGWSFSGAALLLILGVALNRLLAAQVDVFFPGSVIINRIAPYSSYPTSLKLGMVLFNFAIWTALLYAVASLVTSRRRGVSS